jgi:hypothetical protein
MEQGKGKKWIQEGSTGHKSIDEHSLEVMRKGG